MSITVSQIDMSQADFLPGLLGEAGKTLLRDAALFVMGPAASAQTSH